GGGEGRRSGGRRHLVEQIHQLLDRADEITGRQLGRQELLQPLAACPRVCGPGEAEVRLAQEGQLVVLLDLVELIPDLRLRGESLLYRAMRQPRQPAVAGPACLE